MYEETTMSVENVINELNKADGSNQDIHHVNSDKDLSVLSNNGGTTSHSFSEITIIKVNAPSRSHAMLNRVLVGISHDNICVQAKD